MSVRRFRTRLGIRKWSRIARDLFESHSTELGHHICRPGGLSSVSVVRHMLLSCASRCVGICLAAALPHVDDAWSQMAKVACPPTVELPTLKARVGSRVEDARALLRELLRKGKGGEASLAGADPIQGGGLERDAMPAEAHLVHRELKRGKRRVAAHVFVASSFVHIHRGCPRGVR